MSIPIHTTWFIIVNPKSGSHHPKRLNLLCNLLTQKDVSFKKVTTTHPLHATELVQHAIEQGHRNFIISGGDGTYNEVVNGIFLQKDISPSDITLAMIPSGTGNDWIKTMHIPFEIEKIVELIIQKKSMRQDIGHVTYFEQNQQRESYFLNVAGTGFDSYVAQNFLTEKKFGKLSYFIGILKGAVSYKNTNISIYLPSGEEIKTKFFLLAVGICKYFASGRKICPEAVPNDGLFDLTLFKDVNKWKMLAQINKISKGKFGHLSKVQSIRSESFRVTSDQPIYLQSDGELMGHTPFEFSIIPESLNVIVHQDLSFS